jgi:hypothetical protein
MAKANIDPIIRFSSKYVVDQETGCWNWIAYCNKGGYGNFSLDHFTRVLAHRFSYEYYVGPLNNELQICHNCNNRKCVRPDHLRQDTRSSNAIDMVKIKKQHLQILSVKEVIEIKKALKHYYRGQQKYLSDFYKVNPVTISDIKRGKRWSHVVID